MRAIDWAKAENASPDAKRRQKRINIDSRGGPGYTVKGWYIFAPPGGTTLLRRLQLLGSNFEERESYQKLFKDIYNCRCAAVHKGKLTQKKKKSVLSLDELAKKGDSLCVELIKKILHTKKLPDWNRLILGDAIETNDT